MIYGPDDRPALRSHGIGSQADAPTRVVTRRRARRRAVVRSSTVRGTTTHVASHGSQNRPVAEPFASNIAPRPQFRSAALPCAAQDDRPANALAGGRPLAREEYARHAASLQRSSPQVEPLRARHRRADSVQHLVRAGAVRGSTWAPPESHRLGRLERPADRRAPLSTCAALHSGREVARRCGGPRRVVQDRRQAELGCVLPARHGLLPTRGFRAPHWRRRRKPSSSWTRRSRTRAGSACCRRCICNARNIAEAIPVLQQLIEAAPDKKRYWMQLSSVYVQMEDYANGLAIMQLAYNVGLLTEDSEIRRLADLLRVQRCAVSRRAGARSGDRKAAGDARREAVREAGELLDRGRRARQVDRAAATRGRACAERRNVRPAGRGASAARGLAGGRSRPFSEASTRASSRIPATRSYGSGSRTTARRATTTPSRSSSARGRRPSTSRSRTATSRPSEHEVEPRMTLPSSRSRATGH